MYVTGDLYCESDEIRDAISDLFDLKAKQENAEDALIIDRAIEILDEVLNVQYL